VNIGYNTRYRKGKTMKTRKPRQQKFFNEKFSTNIEKITCNTRRDVWDAIQKEAKATEKQNVRNMPPHERLKKILAKNELYNGSFFISPELINHKLLGLNLEDVYLDLATLKKQDHGDKSWCYREDEFQRVFVVYNDGEKALCALNYNDSWSPIILDTVFTLNTYFEGNICRNII
jgi:hypothetical protein